MRWQDIDWDYKVTAHYWESSSAVTIEELYQAFKARMAHEHAEEARLAPHSADCYLRHEGDHCSCSPVPTPASTEP